MKNTIKKPKFLLPQEGISLEKWACIACDQHTSDLGYWQELAKFVGEEVSTLNLMLPEVYLHSDNKARRLEAIKKHCRTYASTSIFNEYNGFVAIERWVSNDAIRKGLLVAIDLQDYSFEVGTKALIRASEGTVLERIPPRVEGKEVCDFDLSHTMLLYNDKDFIVQKAINSSDKKRLYDFELNMGGGRIRGELIESGDKILEAFSKVVIGGQMLFAVGDGNHSLASAKAIYEKTKDINKRFVLAEAVNLYDEALLFEPIHRLVFTDKVSEFISELQAQMPICPIESVRFVDDFIKAKNLEVDYIHGIEHLQKLAKQNNAVAVELKPMNKSDFFSYIIKNGALPKKTFSMGEAEDKRYYLEIMRN
ncbi:MAG: DUF1015 domain-containing protein [Firmicutes bacterium]|nr:DUF1015 domain-containing protein [Bacillota bacterium]